MPKNTYQVIENHNLALQAAKEKLGLNIVNLGWSDLNDKKVNVPNASVFKRNQPWLILGLIWQILKVSK